MNRVSVDAGAFRMVLNMLTRAAERHGERTLADAANEIRATAEVIESPAPAPVAVPDDVRKALCRARNIAMKNTAYARIPECGDFGAIAQELDWAIGALLDSAKSVKVGGRSLPAGFVHASPVDDDDAPYAPASQTEAQSGGPVARTYVEWGRDYLAAKDAQASGPLEDVQGVAPSDDHAKQSQIDGWLAVCSALESARPGFMLRSSTSGKDCAVLAIKEMAAELATLRAQLAASEYMAAKHLTERDEFRVQLAERDEQLAAMRALYQEASNAGR